MSAFWIIRVTSLITVLLLSFAVAGLSANFLAKFTTFDIPGFLEVSIPPWAILSVVAAGASMLLITPMIVIDFVRRGAMTSWVVTELIVFSVLSVTWLAAAADSTVGFDLSFLARYGFAKTCQGLDDFVTDVEALAIGNPEQYGFLLDLNLDSFGMLCRSHQAVQALTFLSWIILIGYAVTLLLSALMASSRGHPAIWTSTVRDTRFLAHHDGHLHGAEIEVPMAAAQHDYYASSQSFKTETQGFAPESMAHSPAV